MHGFSNALIYLLGDAGSAWFIILKGSVNVQLTRTGRIEDTIVVNRLNVGYVD
jgi:hypothetical protein